MKPGYKIIELQKYWFGNKSFEKILVGNYSSLKEVVFYGYSSESPKVFIQNIVAVFKIKWK